MIALHISDTSRSKCYDVSDRDKNMDADEHTPAHFVSDSSMSSNDF